MTRKSTPKVCVAIHATKIMGGMVLDNGTVDRAWPALSKSLNLTGSRLAFSLRFFMDDKIVATIFCLAAMVMLSIFQSTQSVAALITSLSYLAFSSWLSRHKNLDLLKLREDIEKVASRVDSLSMKDGFR